MKFRNEGEKRFESQAFTYIEHPDFNFWHRIKTQLLKEERLFIRQKKLGAKLLCRFFASKIRNETTSSKNKTWSMLIALVDMNFLIFFYCIYGIINLFCQLRAHDLDPF